MSSIVLLHGAFRGGWCWRDVVPLLEAAGHDVHAPTLTGCEPGLAPADRPAVSLRTWADDVQRVMSAADLHDVVLVGHSQGGVVALAAAGVDASRVGRLVLLDAPVPAYGQSAADVLPAELRPRGARRRRRRPGSTPGPWGARSGPAATSWPRG